MNADLEALRAEATRLCDEDPTNLALRSCWECNPAHEHLRNAEYVILCFQCGRYWFRGTDITVEDDPQVEEGTS